MGEIVVENYAPYLAIQIVRPFFVYGPRQDPSMLIPRLMSRVQAGEAIQLQGEDGISLNPIFVDDAVAAVESALTLRQSHKINIGGPETLSMRQIGETIGSVLGKVPEFEMDLSATKQNLVADIGKMCSLLAAPRVRFHEGIARSVDSLTWGRSTE